MNQTAQNDLAPVQRQATAREFLSVIFRRKWLIIGLFAATTLTVLAVALATPSVFSSTARVLIRRGEQQNLLTGYRSVINDWEADLASEIEVAKSFPVIQRTRELLKAEPKGGSIRVNPRQVDAEVMGKSNVLALSYDDADPDVAKQVCDAYSRAYIDYRQNSMTLNYPKSFFDREIEKVHADLEMWTERRRRFSTSNEVVSVPDQTRMLFDLQSQLVKRRSDLTTDLAQSEATVASMQQLRGNPESDLPSIGVDNGPGSIFVLRQKLLDQQARLALVRERYRDDSPEVMGAMETVRTLQDMLKREVNSRVDLAQSKIQSLRAGLAVVDHDLATNRSQLAGLPAKEIALEQMDREISVLKERYRSLTQDSDKARVTEKVTPTINVVLLSPAGIAVSKTTRDWIRIVLAPAFSLVVGIGLAFFIEGLDVTVRTSGQAEDAIELPVLAALNERRRSSR
jgi:uncharacterized protein involved in exopolysaccharide biosynthesis